MVPPSIPLPSADLEAIAAESFWSELKGQRILFTGASGFFGSWLLESYLFAAHQWNLGGKAVALTRNLPRFAERFPHLVNQVGLETIEAEAQTFTANPGGLDVIIHSLVPDPGLSLEQCRDFFHETTARLLKVARDSGCRRLLLCSTGSVYQPQTSPRPFAEGDPLIPLDSPLSYGRIRREVEDQCRQSAEETGLSVKIARGFAFHGPRLPLDGNFAIGNFLRDAFAGNPITVESDGSAIRSYLYAADMTRWLWAFLAKESPLQICNVGSEQPISIRDLAGLIAEKFGVDCQINGKASTGAAPSRYTPCTQAARRELGLQERIALLAGIENTRLWHSSASRSG